MVVIQSIQFVFRKRQTSETTRRSKSRPKQTREREREIRREPMVPAQHCWGHSSRHYRDMDKSDAILGKSWTEMRKKEVEETAGGNKGGHHGKKRVRV